MGLKEMLAKMKLVELDPAAAPPPAPPAPAPSRRPAPPAAAPAPRSAAVDLEAILGALPPAPAIDERQLQKSAPKEGEGSEIPDFPAIYRAAAVTDPPHGFTAFKVLEILSSSEFAALEPRAKAAALAGFLKMVPGGPVPIGDVVQDAVRRDQALDRFEAFLAGKLREREAAAERELARLQAEIDELTRKNQQAIAAHRQRLAAEQERLAAWQAAKRIEERRLADAVAPFVEKNPISLAPARRDVPSA